MTQPKLLRLKPVAELSEQEHPGFTPGLYRHYKGGLYTALFLAADSTCSEGTPLVIYVSLHSGTVFSRPLFGKESAWSDTLIFEGGEKVTRFMQVQEVKADGTA